MIELWGWRWRIRINKDHLITFLHYHYIPHLVRILELHREYECRQGRAGTVQYSTVQYSRLGWWCHIQTWVPGHCVVHSWWQSSTYRVIHDSFHTMLTSYLSTRQEKRSAQDLAINKKIRWYFNCLETWKANSIDIHMLCGMVSQPQVKPDWKWPCILNNSFKVYVIVSPYSSAGV